MPTLQHVPNMCRIFALRDIAPAPAEDNKSILSLSKTRIGTYQEEQIDFRRTLIFDIRVFSNECITVRYLLTKFIQVLRERWIDGERCKVEVPKLRLLKGTNTALKSRRIYPKYMPKCSEGSTNYVCNFLPKNIE